MGEEYRHSPACKQWGKNRSRRKGILLPQRSSGGLFPVVRRGMHPRKPITVARGSAARNRDPMSTAAVGANVARGSEARVGASDHVADSGDIAYDPSLAAEGREH